MCATVNETDAAAFYTEKDDDAIRRAKEICMACPVVEECLTYAMHNREGFGVWGGLTVHERRRMRTLGLGVREAIRAYITSRSKSGHGMPISGRAFRVVH